MICSWDVQEVVSKRQPTPKVPLFMGGHSMGGMVTLMSAIQRPDLWQVPPCFINITASITLLLAVSGSSSSCKYRQQCGDIIFWLSVS